MVVFLFFNLERRGLFCSHRVSCGCLPFLVLLIPFGGKKNVCLQYHGSFSRNLEVMKFDYSVGGSMVHLSLVWSQMLTSCNIK